MLIEMLSGFALLLVIVIAGVLLGKSKPSDETAGNMAPTGMASAVPVQGNNDAVTAAIAAAVNEYRKSN